MSAPTAAIRPATADDLDRLAELEAGSFGEPWSRAQIGEELGRADSLMMVCSLPDHRCAGYLAARCLAPEAEILRIAVAAELRRRGLGRDLLSRGLRDLAQRGCERFFLEVREDADAALALYSAAGFRPAGRRPGYYPDGTAARLLELTYAAPPGRGLR